MIRSATQRESSVLYFGACLERLLLSAKDQPSNGGIRLPIIDATDRVFVPIRAGEEASHDWVGQITDDSQGFLWFTTRDGLDRYDGYQIRHYNPDPNGSNNGVFVQECLPLCLARITC